MEKRIEKSKKFDTKPVTMGDLGKFTEEVIFPGVERIVGRVETRVGGLETRIGGLETRIGGLEMKVDKLRDDVIDEVRQENHKTIVSNDKVMTKLDTVINDFAAHTYSHKRIDDTLLEHESRLKKVETAVKL